MTKHPSGPDAVSTCSGCAATGAAITMTSASSGILMRSRRAAHMPRAFRFSFVGAQLRLRRSCHYIVGDFSRRLVYRALLSVDRRKVSHADEAWWAAVASWCLYGFVAQ